MYYISITRLFFIILFLMKNCRYFTTSFKNKAPIHLAELKTLKKSHKLNSMTIHIINNNSWYNQNEIDTFLNQQDIVKLFAPIELDHIKRYSTYLREVKVPHEETQITHTQTEYAGTLQNIDVTALGRDFKSFFSQYDQRRNQNFIKTFPRLSEWYAGL